MLMQTTLVFGIYPIVCNGQDFDWLKFHTPSIDTRSEDLFL